MNVASSDRSPKVIVDSVSCEWSERVRKVHDRAAQREAEMRRYQAQGDIFLSPPASPKPNPERATRSSWCVIA